MVHHVDTALANLDGPPRQVMDMVADDPDYTADQVAQAFAAYGRPVTPGDVVAWRNTQAERRKAVWGHARPGA